MESEKLYGVRLVVTDLGWVPFHLHVPSSCPAAQPIHLSKQNWAGSGMAKIKANPTQVRDHQTHPVEKNIF